jgi:hypothetical protein
MTDSLHAAISSRIAQSFGNISARKCSLSTETFDRIVVPARVFDVQIDAISFQLLANILESSLEISETAGKFVQKNCGKKLPTCQEK